MLKEKHAAFFVAHDGARCYGEAGLVKPHAQASQEARCSEPDHREQPFHHRQ
jgi:hypothetical protein